MIKDVTRFINTTGFELIFYQIFGYGFVNIASSLTLSLPEILAIFKFKEKCGS
ncbi:unnamed protein product [Moneuplotes crassus]|uniref:Uncharacterized protein n=1 Tax=Euplotes crassus TaxID=5936 RepID=A0AAD1UIK9_EUPCR|nr:unnamed protein product [Moneuplotes crassus]